MLLHEVERGTPLFSYVKDSIENPMSLTTGMPTTYTCGRKMQFSTTILRPRKAYSICRPATLPMTLSDTQPSLTTSFCKFYKLLSILERVGLRNSKLVRRLIISNQLMINRIPNGKPAITDSNFVSAAATYLANSTKRTRRL